MNGHLEGVLMILAGLAMAAADKKLEDRFNGGSVLVLLYEFVAFMLVLVGLVVAL